MQMVDLKMLRAIKTSRKS